MVMARVPGYDKDIVIACKYLQRTWRKESPAPHVLTCSASSLESIGVENCFKSLFAPKNGLKLVGVVSDGDVKDSVRVTLNPY